MKCCRACDRFQQKRLLTWVAIGIGLLVYVIVLAGR